MTHVVNRKVKVKGFASEDGKQIYEFEIEIDRESDDERDISKNIEKCFSQLNNAKLFSSSESTELHTEFTYTLTDDLGKEALEEGIEELRNNIPFVLTFNEIIEEVVIDGEVFRKEVQKVNNSISKVIVNGRAVYIKEDDENGFQVAILINNGAISNLKGYPKIFIGMPLIETADYINIPFAINSVLFDSTKERDALSSESEKNRELLNCAFEGYKQLINEILEIENTMDLFNTVDIQLIPEKNIEQNPLWNFFNKQMINIFQQILESTPLVSCLEGRRPIKDVVFPDNKFRNERLEDELFDSFYSLLCEIKKNVPKKNELNGWIEVAQNLSGIEDFSNQVSLYDIEDMRDDLKSFVDQQENLPTFEEFAENFGLEDSKQFLLNFFALVERLYQRKIIASDFIDYLLPDQTGVIGFLKWSSGQLHIDDGIPEKLKEILHKIGWEIKEELVDNDFAKFEIVKDYVRESLDTDTALRDVIEDQETKLDDNKLKKEEWDDNILGWTELLWWCVENDKLLKDFPIITKSGTVRTIEDLNKETISLPFEYMGFDEKYEYIFPDTRIIHPKYFEVPNYDEIIKKLEKYKVFITHLPIYKNSLTVGYNKLKSIMVDDIEISKTTHKIETVEGDISFLPFWDEVIGGISEYHDRGKLLFEFVVRHLINNDERWGKETQVICSCKEKEHKIIPSHWLASLKTDAWVPFKVIEKVREDGEEKEKEKIVKREATKESIENLFSLNELEELIKSNPDKICKLLPHFGFDKLDLKIKLQSIEKSKPEEDIREEVSVLVDIADIAPELKEIVSQNLLAFKEAIKKLKETLEREPIRVENRIIGENLEKVIKRIIDNKGLRAIPIYKGGDLEIWPDEEEGCDSGLIEISPYLLEIKFTSGGRVHLSKAQSDMARNREENYVVLVVENVDNLRDNLKEIDESSIPEEIISVVISNSYIIEQIYTKLGEMPNPDEVEPDIQGYWIKRRLWYGKDNILVWLQQKFGDGV